MIRVFHWPYLLIGLVFSFLLGTTQPGRAAEPTPGKFKLTLRDRQPSPTVPDYFTVREREETWDAKKTAIIVCDMWDLHHCKRAVDRVKEVAPRMNQLLVQARSQGSLIIHAPSSCMPAYENTPMRQRAKNAPPAKNLPKDIASWCKQIPSEEKGKYPIDQTDGGEDDEAKEHADWAAHLTALGRNPRAPWKSQYDVLKMDERDAVSDSGVEIWNLLEEKGIQHVILVGVHTNMCVLGRPFGLRQLAKNGKQVVLMRDMTDTMYNPAKWPYVSHFRGTDLIVEHIEKYVCPTVTSNQVLAGEVFRFKGDVRPVAVFAISEDEYKTWETLPQFTRAVVTDRLGIDCVVLQADPKNSHIIPGLADALAKADLLVLSMRRKALPEKDLQAVRDHIAKGKAVVAIRTSSHGFDAKGNIPAGHAVWPKFDPEVLGGNYKGHHKDGPTTEITRGGEQEKIPLLTGVALTFTSQASLYKVNPLEKSASPILFGKIPDQPMEPIAWTNQVGKSRVFYTTLGHVKDFEDASFRRLLSNAMLWALELPIPAQ